MLVTCTASGRTANFDGPFKLVLRNHVKQDGVRVGDICPPIASLQINETPQGEVIHTLAGQPVRQLLVASGLKASDLAPPGLCLSRSRMDDDAYQLYNKPPKLTLQLIVDVERDNGNGTTTAESFYFDAVEQPKPEDRA